MKVVPVEDAIGMVLSHDMTEIIPGQHKSAAFKKGYVLKANDVERLLNMGKRHIPIIEYQEGDVHEDEAALKIAKAATGSGIILSEPSEGKVSLTSEYYGLLKINTKALMEINMIEDIMIATSHANFLVEAGNHIAGTRIFPLITAQENINKVEKICYENYPVIQVVPLKKINVGVVITGSEVYHGRIEDKFGPTIHKKFNDLGSNIMGQIYADDDPAMIASAINTLIRNGAEMITVTGGMSVDADDVTPLGIKMAGAQIECYGAPVLPGAMFLLSYFNEIPIVGLPGCVMYSKRTIFDLILPRLLIGEKVYKKDIIKLGHGGLCMECNNCNYPNCGFGKGGFF